MAAKELVLVECDAFHVTQRDGRLLLELVGATATATLPACRNYLNPAQIAVYLGVNVRTVSKLMNHPTNPIPFARLGKAPRFVTEDVDRWAAASKTCGAKRAAVVIAAKPPAPAATLFGARKYSSARPSTKSSRKPPDRPRGRPG